MSYFYLWLSSNALIEVLLEMCPAFSQFIMLHIFFNRNLISSTFTNENVLLRVLHRTNTSFSHSFGAIYLDNNMLEAVLYDKSKTV